MTVRVMGVFLLALLPAMGCTKSTSTAVSSVASLASHPLVSSLTSGLGLNANQAIGGAGALLGLAQENLAAPDWSKVAAAIPQASTLITQGKALGGITGKIGSLGNLSGAFSKLGLNADQVSALTPALTDYVSKAAGPEVGALLAGAIK
jgi:Protein of unknown function VcgC/VcgE (DUF2780)